MTNDQKTTATGIIGAVLAAIIAILKIFNIQIPPDVARTIEAFISSGIAVVIFFIGLFSNKADSQSTK